MKPNATLEISYDDPLAAYPTWVDETAYLRGFNVHRGRQNELDQQQAGTCELILDNRTGRFDPANSAGANYPNVVPMRRVRLSVRSLTETVPATFTLEHTTYVGDGAHAIEAGDGSTLLWMFTGFIEAIAQTWEFANGDAAVQVSCVDGFKYLNLTTAQWGFFWDSASAAVPPYTLTVYGSTFIEDVLVADVVVDGGPSLAAALVSPPGHSSAWLTGEDVDLTLDVIHWPGERRLDPGTVGVLHQDASSRNIPINENALSYLLKVAETEGGLFFIGQDGAAVFLDQTSLAVPAIGLELYGGHAGEIGYRDAVVEFNDTRIWNDMSVTAGDQRATASDATSQDNYWSRALSIDLLEIGTYEAYGAAIEVPTEIADLYLARYKDPQLRITSLVLSPMRSADWLALLSHDLGEFIRVKKRPATANEIDQTLRIEGISIVTGTEARNTWTVTLSLSTPFVAAPVAGGMHTETGEAVQSSHTEDGEYVSGSHSETGAYVGSP